MKDYVLTTARLGLRNWDNSDFEPFHEMNNDPEVMKYFPRMLSREDSQDFINRMQTHFNEYGFCYFAADELDSGAFIGMIGLLHQKFESNYTPCVDIGWRLKRSSWGKGYATEGAQACIDAGLNDFQLDKIYSFAPKINHGSINVMKKIGMIPIGEFQHPKLLKDERLRDCAVFLSENK